MRSAWRTGDLEGGQVLEVLAIHAAAAEDVHDIVDERCRVAFARHRDVTYAEELLPGLGVRVVLPCVVVVVLAIGAAKAAGAIELLSSRRAMKART
jgi:TATA-box binding protein (TBP) (component of TFIID and TFIIIB)